MGMKNLNGISYWSLASLATINNNKKISDVTARFPNIEKQMIFELADFTKHIIKQ